ncbi:MAG: hypothetical protein L6367_16380 [Cellulomonas sp.]|nr:hypothetical protein [Cellulomonas sp.]
MSLRRIYRISAEPRRAEDEGNALVLVVGSMLVLAMLALSGLAYSIGSTQFARGDQDYLAAEAAAQSGIEDYLARLNRDDTYYSTVDCTNAALQGPISDTNACGWTSATAAGWAPVTTGDTGDKDAFFHYSVNAADVASNTLLTVTSTGRVNGKYRTLEARLGKSSSSDYVYYTDFESADPANTQAYSGTVPTACGGTSDALYWYTGRSSASCQEIVFADGDVLNGDVFSNDAVATDGYGPYFKASFESANPTCKSVTATTSTWNSCLRSSSKARFSVQPAYSEPKKLDDTSAALASKPGCHYYGSTRIVFNSDGTMTVWNKTSVNNSTAPTVTQVPGGSTTTCGDVDALNSTAGATVPVPDNGVIYVGSSTATARQCYASELGGPTGATLPLGTYNGTNSSSYTADVNMLSTTKYCREGNAYIEGTLKGRVTVATAQSVIVAGDVMLANGLTGSDKLGLVATNSVEVISPQLATYSGTTRKTTAVVQSGWPRNYGGVSPGVQVMASIQTLQHSFFVQMYSTAGYQGTLQVNGSIAQKYRGIVGQGVSSSSTSGNGYMKNYVYDSRLRYSAPPYFPDWVGAQWEQRYLGEIDTPASLRT